MNPTAALTSRASFEDATVEQGATHVSGVQALPNCSFSRRADAGGIGGLKSQRHGERHACGVMSTSMHSYNYRAHGSKSNAVHFRAPLASSTYPRTWARFLRTELRKAAALSRAALTRAPRRRPRGGAASTAAWSPHALRRLVTWTLAFVHSFADYASTQRSDIRNLVIVITLIIIIHCWLLCLFYQARKRRLPTFGARPFRGTEKLNEHHEYRPNVPSANPPFLVLPIGCFHRFARYTAITCI